MYDIGIDLGSTYIKTVLLDVAACRIEEQNKVRVPPRIKYASPNYYEVPAAEIVKIVREQIDGYAGAGRKIGGIFLATQMHGFVYTRKDREDVYVSWQDMRCLNRTGSGNYTYMDDLRERIPDDDLRMNGIHLKPSLGFCNLYTLLQEENVGRDGELYTLGSYIGKQLTGRNVCHIMNGAPLGLVNIAEGRWDERLIRRLGLAEIRFPQLTSEDTKPVGTYSCCGQEIPIYPDFGDQQCAILGSMCTFEDAVINIATASQVSVTERTCPEPGTFEVRPYFAGTYLKTISNMPAGRNLDVLVSFLRRSAAELTGTEPEDSLIWSRIAEDGCEDPQGLSVDPMFYPLPDRQDGGAICGITDSNFRIGCIFAAAFRSMAQIYWDHIRLLKDEAHIRKLVCAGGVSWKRPELVREIRRVSGKDCVLSPIPDETVQGLYRIALVCEGICRNFEELPEHVLRVKEAMA